MSYFGHDPEVPAGFQDADIEQAQFERAGARLRVLKRRGICAHGWVCGLGADGKPHYPEAEGLTGAEVRCRDCGKVFADDDAWHEARESVL